MKNYAEFDAVDFAQDDDFLKWVKQGKNEPELDRFWRSFLASHPEKAHDVTEAKQMVAAILNERQHHVDFEREREVWSRLQRSIEQEHPLHFGNTKRGNVRLWPRIARVAAMISLVIVAFALTWWWSRDDISTVQTLSKAAEWQQEVNNSALPKTVFLSDGSSVVLQPKSILYYHRVFDSDYREVKLEGEAFFEVAKDPNKPFLVYADKIVSKVLGTSFVVRAFRDERDVKVLVKTGKVSVYTDDDIEVNKNIVDKQLQGVLLTPNQQAIFSKEDAQLVKSLVEDPQVLVGPKSRDFEFIDTPLRDVFATLEKAYGIEIVYDEELMGNCALNASLDDMPLYDKMRLICKGVNAKFEILDSKIVVAGKGCNY